jgi:hypothetical protein
MNCPHCGLQLIAGQRFCRSCGTSLQTATQPLADATVPNRNNMPAILFKGEKQRSGRLVLWAFIMMFIGAAIGVIGKKLMHEEIVTVVGILISLAGMFFALYPYLSLAPRQKYDSSRSTQTEVLTPSQATNYLPQGSNIEYAPSITERTTDLLKNPAATRPKQKEDEEMQA